MLRGFWIGFVIRFAVRTEIVRCIDLFGVYLSGEQGLQGDEVEGPIYLLKVPW